MIPFIRSFSELMAMTEYRDNRIESPKNNEVYISTIDSAQRKRYIRSIERKKVNLPDLPKTIKYKWDKKKEAVSKFLDTLDYNNEIKKSYDLTLIARLNKDNHKDAA